METRSMAFLLISVTLSVLGLILPQPLLPELRKVFGLMDAQVGLIVSAQSMGLMGAGLVLPMLSDRVGQRKVLYVGHVFSSAGYLLQGIAIAMRWPFKGFLALRFLTGCVTCNPIFKAYIGASVPQDRVPQFMVYREAAAQIAAVVGPFACWFVSSYFSPACCLYAIAIMHLTASALLYNTKESRKKDSKSSASSNEDSNGSFLSWTLAGIFVTSLFYVVAQMCFSTFFSLLMVDRFHIATRDVGKIMTKVSFLALMFQMFLYRPVSKRLGFTATSVLGGLSLFLGMSGFGIASLLGQSLSVFFWLSAALYACGNATFPATIPTLIANNVPPSRIGTAMGLDSVFNNLCRIVAPLILGGAYAMGPMYCFAIAGISVLVAVVLFIAIRLRSKA